MRVRMSERVRVGERMRVGENEGGRVRVGEGRLSVH